MDGNEMSGARMKLVGMAVLQQRKRQNGWIRRIPLKIGRFKSHPTGISERVIFLKDNKF
jgi:hypothetical protein